jgi:hypothetical protein
MTKKALFIFFEGLPENVIDSQVLTHCRLMKQLDIDFEIWSFACFDDLYQSSLKRLNKAKELSGCEVKLFKGVRPAYPFSEKINAYRVKALLKNHQTQFDFIHARTDYSTAVVCQAVKNIPIIYDCRGDSVAEFEYSNKGNYFSKKYRVAKYQANIKTAKLLSKKAIFVSHFLKNKINYSKQNMVIGCAANSELFYFDEKLREATRTELGFTKQHKVLIYSGGMNEYQCFNNCVEYFENLLQQDKNWQFLILTTAILEAQKYIGNTKNVTLKKVPFAQVNQYLNAADVGMIIREQNDLNRAASPTKFAEYALSGLSVCFSKGIGDLENYAKNIEVNNQLDNQDFNDIHNLEMRILTAKKAKKIVSKKSVMQQYQEIYA